MSMSLFGRTSEKREIYSDLLARAQKLHVYILDIEGTDDALKGSKYMREQLGPFSMAEIQKRVLEAESHRRQNRLWRVAVLSAVFSAISAMASWLAVYRARPVQVIVSPPMVESSPTAQR
jgi:hypothetical protein